MKSMRPHKSLLVWQESIQLVILVYETMKQLPTDEKFGLISQMKRASVSVPANISEGAARKSNKEYVHFLHIASGSLSELDTLCEICFKLKYIEEQQYKILEEQMNKVSALLIGLIQKRNSFNIKMILSWVFSFPAISLP